MAPLSFWDDPAFWAGVGLSVLAYAVGGLMHILIDYVHGKRLLRKYWDATDTKIAAIEGQVTAGVRGELLPSIDQELKTLEGRFGADLAAQLAAMRDDLRAELTPENAQAPAFEAFLRSPGGVQWATALAEDTGDRVIAAVRDMMTSKAGNVARKVQSDIARQVLAAMNSLDWGNPILNGGWAMISPSTKLQWYNRLARVLRETGFAIVPLDGINGPLDTEGNVLESEVPDTNDLVSNAVARWRR